MPVRFLAKAKPFGDYPIADTEDIQHGTKRLDVALSDIETVNERKADKTYVDTELAKKVDKVSGKGLSTNDYTTSDKDKLSTIESGATKTIIDDTLTTSSTNPIQNKAVATALNGKADSSTVSVLSTRVGTAETNISTQTARIDNIANLPSGSTSGDAELIDIRVGADSVTYTSAGSAVRSQITDVKNDLDRYCSYDNSNKFSGKIIDLKLCGNVKIDSGNYESGKKLYCSGKNIYPADDILSEFKKPDGTFEIPVQTLGDDVEKYRYYLNGEQISARFKVKYPTGTSTLPHIKYTDGTVESISNFEGEVDGWLIYSRTTNSNKTPFYLYYSFVQSGKAIFKDFQVEFGGSATEFEIPSIETINIPNNEHKMFESNEKHHMIFANYATNVSVEVYPIHRIGGTLTLDHFIGDTAEDRLYNALDVIDRGVIIAGDVKITKHYTPKANKAMRNIIISNGKLIFEISDADKVWMKADTQATNLNLYCPSFSNCYIECNNNEILFGTQNSNTDLVVSSRFNNCVLQNVCIQDETNGKWNQSTYFSNCDIQGDRTLINVRAIWNMVFHYCRIEAGANPLVKSTIDSTSDGNFVSQLIFDGCLIEGRTSEIVNVGKATDLRFNHCYFEDNYHPYIKVAKNTDVFEFTNNVVIEFESKENNYIIDNSETINSTIVTGNSLTLPSGMRLMKETI